MNIKLSFDNQAAIKPLQAELGKKIYTEAVNKMLKHMGFETIATPEEIVQLIQASEYASKIDTLTMQVCTENNKNSIKIEATHNEKTKELFSLSIETDEKADDTLEQVWEDWGKNTARHLFAEVIKQ